MDRRIPLLLLAALLLSACTTRERRIHGDAAWRALTAPNTYVPLAAAAVIAAADLDEDISNELAGPQKVSLRNDVQDGVGLVSSRQEADDISAIVLQTSPLLWLGPTIANSTNYCCGRNGGDDHYTTLKWQAAIGATAVTFGMNRALKDNLGVVRPDGNGEGSFPSTNAALTSVAATLSRREIERLPISGTQKKIWQTVVTAWPVAASLMRIEAKRHFATDVLVGYAIGSFWGEYSSNLADAYRCSTRPTLRVKRTQEDAVAFQLGISHAFP